MNKFFKNNKNKLTEILKDDDKRIELTHYSIFAVFALVASVMTIVNIISDKKYLTIATAVFAILCLFDIILYLVISGKGKVIALVAFAIEVMFLFTYFVVSGNPDGFSIYWITLLPTFALLIYGMKYGTFLSTFFFLIIIFFFWVPFGRSLLLYDYPKTVYVRFPMLYVTCFFVAFLIEFLRNIAKEELERTRNNYHFLYEHDSLTGIYNRYGFNVEKDKIINNCPNPALALLDIDHFKYINDTFGHQNGDLVLKKVVEIISEVVKDDAVLCRWGGEEFIIFFKSADYSKEKCEEILDKIRHYDFVLNKNHFNLTVSIGLIRCHDELKPSLNRLVKQADDLLYKAKNNGRDNLVFGEYIL